MLSLLRKYQLTLQPYFPQLRLLLHFPHLLLLQGLVVPLLGLLQPLSLFYHMIESLLGSTGISVSPLTGGENGVSE